MVMQSAGVRRRILLGLGWVGLVDTVKAGRAMTQTHFTDAKLGPLEAAIGRDDATAMRRALDAGAEVNARSPKGVTPLMIAVDARRAEAVQVLLGAGADPNLRAVDGASAVSLAVENYRDPVGAAIMRAVLGAGGSPNAKRPDNDPIIMRFMNDRDCEQIRYLKSLGADLNAKTRAGDALVSDAAVAGDWDVVWCLLELGADPDQERTRHPLTRSLARKVPSPDSPIYQYKIKVWHLLKDRGFAVPALPSQPATR